MQRVIFHVDMDAFFASIEQRDNPELRGKPLVVGGGGRRGVVAAASYEARKFGVFSAMPMVVALRKCPHIAVVPPDGAKYSAASKILMEVLRSYSPSVEPLSLDEAFVDMTGTQRLFGTPLEAAASIKKDVFEKTNGLTASVGIASNKFLAKLASDLDKPDGISVIPFGKERETIAPFDIRKLWGVGKKTEIRLRELGFHTVADIANCPIDVLENKLGKRSAAHFSALANAQDSRPVVAGHGRKSLGSENTYHFDISGRAAIQSKLRGLADGVASQVRSESLRARGVRVKLRYSETFSLQTRQGLMNEYQDDSDSFYNMACQLLDTLDLDEPIRLVGIATFDFADEDVPTQASLFQAPSVKRSALEHTLDEIKAKFGDAISRGTDTNEN